MFDSHNTDSTESVFVFGLSSLNRIVERHYEKSPHKEVLSKVVICKNHKMEDNFVVSSRVITNLIQNYSEREGIVNCIKGMLNEESMSERLSPIDSTVKLAQLKQFEGLTVFVITEDEREESLCKQLGISCLSPAKALEKLNELHGKLNNNSKK